MHWFYCSDILQQPVRLDVLESGHCIKSLRHKKGDEVIVCDGKGSVHRAKIIDDNVKACLLQLGSRIETREQPYKLHIAIAPTKQNERMEWFLEKATEIGLFRITPMLTANSERRKINADRFNKILISAMKQSQQAYLPELMPLSDFKEVLDIGNSGKKFIAHCRVDDLKYLKDHIRPGEDCLILIGPEGDFTEEEVLAAGNAGFTSISLGYTRLRTETAGIVAAQTLAFINL